MVTRLKILYRAILTTSNWPIAVFVWFGFLKNVRARFRNGCTFSLDRGRWSEYVQRVNLFFFLPKAELSEENTVAFDYKSRRLSFDFGRWGFDTIVEIFGGKAYKKFFEFANIKGKQVVDLGAAFGDTAILFLLEGAKRVYAFEALPSYFELAKKNIDTNEFGDRCEIALAVAGGAPGSVVIEPDLGNMFGTHLPVSKSGENVPVVTLRQIVERAGINDGVLKIDTEGFEYEILLNTPPETLRKFSDIVVEYHYGFEEIRDYLNKSGFRTVNTKPVHMPAAGPNSKDMWVGDIFAKRIAVQVAA